MNEPVMMPLDGEPGSYVFWCDGCETLHGINSGWKYNGDAVRPTITPSILSRGEIRCHSYVTDGQIRYLSDSEHELAGKTVPLTRPPWDENDDGADQ